MLSSETRPAGMVALRVYPMPTPLLVIPARELSLREILYFGFPHTALSQEVRRWRRNNIVYLWRGLKRVGIARLLGLPHFYGQLSLAMISPPGERVDYGLASLRVVTTAGVNFIIDALQGLTTLSNLRYHGLGQGGAQETVDNTTLSSELTTQYNPDNTRATGTLTEGTAANIFKTVGIITLDATATIVEHGIFSQAAAPGGTLLDRSTFTAQTVIAGFSVEATYLFTVNAGG